MILLLFIIIGLKGGFMIPAEEMKLMSILIVDDEPKNIQLLGNILKSQDFYVEFAMNGEEALDWISTKKFDLILLDIMMPGMDGFEVCKRIKKHKTYIDVPIIFLTAKIETDDIVNGLGIGGVDYVTKPYISAELLARVKTHLEIKSLRDKIIQMANHDALTGLPTVRLAADRLDLEIEYAKRKEKKVALLFLDLDGFKLVNDTYGHEAGDIVLKTIAKRLLEVLRKTDTCCRIGGDEFLIIISDPQHKKDIEDVCQRIISSVGDKVDYQDVEIVVGVSIGVALYPDNASDANSLRQLADDVMYKVKKTGKNNYLFVE